MSPEGPPIYDGLKVHYLELGLIMDPCNVSMGRARFELAKHT